MIHLHKFVSGARVFYAGLGDISPTDTGTVHAVNGDQVFITWDNGLHGYPETIDGQTGEWYSATSVLPISEAGNYPVQPAHWR